MYELEHDDAILTARQILAAPYIIIDTETTGLAKDTQVVQVGYITEYGEAERMYIKPTIPITASATAVHHITDDMLEDAVSMYAAWQGRLRQRMTGRRLVGYNIGFDLRALKNSLKQWGIDYYPEVTYDVMLLHAGYAQVPNKSLGTPKWFKLEEAMEEHGLEWTDSKHDALADAKATQTLLTFIADQQTYWEKVIDDAIIIAEKTDPSIAIGFRISFRVHLEQLPYAKLLRR